jgi:hypothetical protein
VQYNLRRPSNIAASRNTSQYGLHGVRVPKRRPASKLWPLTTLPKTSSTATRLYRNDRAKHREVRSYRSIRL